MAGADRICSASAGETSIVLICILDAGAAPARSRSAPADPGVS
jgi:hypothetical protein